MTTLFFLFLEDIYSILEWIWSYSISIFMEQIQNRSQKQKLAKAVLPPRQAAKQVKEYQQ